MPLKVLLVDDEALARSRLRSLLAECADPASDVVGEADHAQQALDWLAHGSCDLMLLDVHMPGMDGVELAQRIKAMPQPPAVVFVTAHSEHAVQAFEIDALDYLTKPVRRERLQHALEKAARWVQQRDGLAGAGDADAAGDPAAFLLIQDRGRTERVPVDEVVYFKAELKYVTVRTVAKSHILDGSLNELEARFGPRFVRIHRNALVARDAVRAVEKAGLSAARDADGADAEGWQVVLQGVPERLAVSRRQLSALRDALSH